jgi:tetratricopeptide (TPR) repeat protein
MSIDLDKLLALVISAIALCISILATIYSATRQQSDRVRSIREQLGKIIQQLIEAKAEEVKLSEEKRRGSMDNDVFMQRWQSLHETIDSQTRRAISLATDYPNLDTDIDHAILARSFSLIGEWQQADKSWQCAVASAERAGLTYYRMLDLRGYADFLFSRDRFEEGRARWKAALNCLDSNNDEGKYQNGYTYQLWMRWEAGETARARNCYKEAHQLYLSISNITMRQSSLRDLEDAAKATFGAEAVPLQGN